MGNLIIAVIRLKTRLAKKKKERDKNKIKAQKITRDREEKSRFCVYQKAEQKWIAIYFSVFSTKFAFLLWNNSPLSDLDSRSQSRRLKRPSFILNLRKISICNQGRERGKEPDLARRLDLILDRKICRAEEDLVTVSTVWCSAPRSPTSCSPCSPPWLASTSPAGELTSSLLSELISILSNSIRFH